MIDFYIIAIIRRLFRYAFKRLIPLSIGAGIALAVGLLWFNDFIQEWTIEVDQRARIEVIQRYIQEAKK